jgi:hypothetical protein
MVRNDRFWWGLGVGGGVGEEEGEEAHGVHGMFSTVIIKARFFYISLNRER